MKSIRTPIARISLGSTFVIMLALMGWPKTGVSAGYYNLGAFWRASSGVTPACTAVNGYISTVVNVQNKSGVSASNSSTEAVTFSNNDVLGNVLIASVGFRQNTDTSVSLADTEGNTWAPVPNTWQVNATDGANKTSGTQIWYAPITVGGTKNKVTVTETGGTGYLYLAISEYSGLATTGLIAADASQVAPSLTNAMAVPNLTTTAVGNLIYSFFLDGSTVSSTALTVGAGYAIEASKTSANILAMVEDNCGGSAAAPSNCTAEGANTYAPTGTDSLGTAKNYWSAAGAAFAAQCVRYATFNPTIASISPNGSPLAGGESVTITGNFFDSTATVKIGGATCTGPSTSGITSITCTAPSGLSGAADVVVTDSNGHAVTLASGYLYGTVGAPAWIGGTASGYTWNTYSATALPNFETYGGELEDGLVNINKVVFGVTAGTGYLYVADYSYDMSVGRVMQFNAATGAEVGWIGAIGQTPTGDPKSMGCTTTPPNSSTPGWCTGGASAGGSGALEYVTDGLLLDPTGMTLDSSGSTLYVADLEGDNSRIQKFNASTGAFLGWIGYGAMTGGVGGCPGSGGGITTGWCSGGTVSEIDYVGNEGGFAGPDDVALDPSNTYLYVYDSGNERVEQFNATAGTYVGWLGAVTGPTSPTCASTNPGCTPGTSGQFSGGFVNGGSSTSSSVSGGILNPGGGSAWSYIYADANYLYLSDPLSYRLERYNLPSGTFAGWLGWVGTSNGTNCTTTHVYSGTWCNAGGAAMKGTGAGGTQWAGALDYPQQITSDGTYLYVADAGVANVTRYNLDGSNPVWIGESTSTGLFNGGWGNTLTWSQNTSNFVDPYAGGMNGTSGVTLDTTNGLLYTSDTGNHRINRYTTSTGAFSQYLFNQPVAPTGWLTTGQVQQGLGDGMFRNGYNDYGDGGVALDSVNGMIYASDYSSSRIVKFNASTGAPLGWVGSAALRPTGGASGCTSLNFGDVAPGWCTGGAASAYSNGTDGTYDAPIGIAVDPTGTYIYVANSDGDGISRLKTSDGSPQGFIGLITTTGTGCGASTGPTNGWCVGSHASPGHHTSGTIADTQFSNPIGMAVDASGNIYIASHDDNRVIKTNSAGVSQGWIGWAKNTGGSAQCPVSTGGVANGWCLGGTTTSPTNTALPGGFYEPQWVVVDGNGNLWVSDWGNGRIEQFNASSGQYIGSFNPISGQVLSIGIDGNSKTLITYEDFGDSKSFVRYATATYAMLGEMGYLEKGSLIGGQQGCTGVTPGALPSLWCFPSDPGQQTTPIWGDNSSWIASPTSQLIVDPSNQYMYILDTGNGSLNRIPINN